MKNSIDSILNMKAEFDNLFCSNKYKTYKKCFNFYKKNIAEKKEGVVKCPYGYACIFGDSNVTSSLVDAEISDLALINSRDNYNKRVLKIETNHQIITKEELESILNNPNLEEELDIYKDTFHDLNNNNRYMKDVVENLTTTFKINQKILFYLENLFVIFDEHKKSIAKNTNSNDKLVLYKKEISDISIITSHLLNNKKLKSKQYRELKSNIEFIDYRIRYLKRKINFRNNHHDETFLKNLNLHKIITKLKYAFGSAFKKKEQELIISANTNKEISIKAFDDLYLGFFILFENAIKYSPLRGTITIEILYKEDECIEVNIKNQSKSITNPKVLVSRGVQGDNNKDGSGLGLSIAKNIFSCSNFDLKVNYKNGVFICSVLRKF